MLTIKKSDPKSVLVHCRHCQGSYNRKYFHRHRRACHTEADSTSVKPIQGHLLNAQEKPAFLDLLEGFQQTTIGDLCRTDATIRAIGRHLWLKDCTKVDKTYEVRKSVMADMRTLAALYVEFRGHPDATELDKDASSMFERTNWPILEEAIRSLTVKEDAKVKYGLKNSVYYLLLKSAEILEGEALTVKGEAGKRRVDEMQHFIKLLKHHQNAVFGDSKYLINKARQERLRLPARSPPEEVMQELRDYTLDRVSSLVDIDTSNFGTSDYVELRNLVCSRLTLFNARRGGEPSRMVLEQWLNRHQWIGQMVTDDMTREEQRLFGELDVVYGTGKGNHLVSCLVPKDCVVALDRLSNTQLRTNVGIVASNRFLFPNVASNQHCGGWNALATVCTKANINGDLVNATNQRGRISTIYAGLDVSMQDRELFFSHMGHSAQVNAGTYQRPLAVQTILKVGRHLVSMDKGKTRGLSCIDQFAVGLIFKL